VINVSHNVINGMCSEQVTILYTVRFKLNVIKCAKQHDNWEIKDILDHFHLRKNVTIVIKRKNYRRGGTEWRFIHLLLIGLT
jgi:hypothetical protein